MSTAMIQLTIDGQAVEVSAGTTVLQAAKTLGINIPNLCYREGTCEPLTSCLVCVVRVNGQARLVPSCATVATPGMKVESETPEVQRARRTALELLLGEHAGDCMAPCHLACPTNMNIPLMIQQIKHGDLHEAIITVKDRIPLPAVMGRICPDLCEAICRRKDKDDAVSICRLKRFVADTDLATNAPYQPPCAPPTGKRVAIIGSGPAGISAAYFLRCLGHTITVIEEREQLGGNLRYAVPDERLPKDILDVEINLIKKLGVEFRANTPLVANTSSPGVTLNQIRQQYDAILLACGTIDQKRADLLGLPSSSRGLKVDRETQTVPLPGVFVAGSAIMACKHAIRAIGEGRFAALAIDAYLKGQPPLQRHHEFSTRLGNLSETELSDFNATATNTPRANAPQNDPHTPLTPDQAQLESARCLECGCAKLTTCQLRHTSIQCHAEPTRYKTQRKTFSRLSQHPQLVYEPGKCITCGKCVQITRQAGETLGLTFNGRGFDVQITVPFNESMAAALQTTAAQCIEECPTAALSLPSQS